ncbi:MAG TPA: LPS biosynthesis protein WbpP [Myxococcales bacterium]|nr:LPS biosynthesis protein WbpP [Myxococcales bacterium]
MVVFDDLSTGSLSNLDDVRDAIDWVHGDIRDYQALSKAVAGCDFVFHQAAMASVALSIENPLEHNDINIGGTLNVLEASRLAGVKRVVFAASSAAYGDTEVMPIDETQLPNPLSPYGVAKVTGEQYCRAYHAVYGLETVALRYFNIFGPRQAPGSAYAAVIPLFADCILRGESPTINGDGLHSRDFCFVDNVVQANLKALVAPNAPGNVYNIAVGVQVTLLDLIEAINEVLGTDVEPHHGPERTGDIRHSLADISAAKRDLGYQATVSFKEGLAQTLRWYQSQSN